MSQYVSLCPFPESEKRPRALDQPERSHWTRCLDAAQVIVLGSARLAGVLQQLSDGVDRAADDPLDRAHGRSLVEHREDLDALGEGKLSVKSLFHYPQLRSTSSRRLRFAQNLGPIHFLKLLRPEMQEFRHFGGAVPKLFDMESHHLT